MSDETAARLARLEERLAWLERHVTEQDKVMLEQSRVLDRLVAELRRLREAGGAPRSGAEEEGAGGERPPHY
jgi:SlyX protein